jgi:hypothetical protein
VMKFYREFILQAPEELGGFFAFLTVPPGPPFPENLHNQKVCGIVWCYCGEMDHAENVLKPVRQAIPPLLDLVGPLPFPALQGMFDAVLPPGQQHYWKAIDIHLEYASQLPSWQSTMHLYPINGAVHEKKKGDTAFNFRDANWAEVIVAVDPDPKKIQSMIPWARKYYEALHPYSAGGAYVNFLMDEGQDRIKATYRENYPRLVEIKTKYDPDNFFHVNQNIMPR